MIWVDREIKKLMSLPRGSRGEWVDDMKTPSGKIHVGALRGVLIHDLIYKVLKENNINTKFTYIFDDHDPMDSIPSYLEFSKWEKYAGMQLYKIPSPVPGFKSYAEYYAQDFIKVFESINCHPEIIWASELYNSGKMNKAIKEILDAAPIIREIYFKVSKNVRPQDWYPFNTVCEKCHKVGTTYVYKWDRELVYYRCQPQMVAWAEGCGYEGKISPYNGNGKFSWKIEWPSVWKTLGITIEGAGKDHMSAGGSHDIASAICNEVINYPVPYPVPYEWFTIGGKKMSSSKGVGSSAEEIAKILPPEVFRFLIVRTPIGTALDFNPYGDTLLNLFDDYDRCFDAYFLKLENKIPDGKPGEVLIDFARIFELSEVRAHPKQRIFLPRFRTIVNLLRTNTNIVDFFTNQKEQSLNENEKALLDERIIYAKIYLKNHSEDTNKITPLRKGISFQLNEKQTEFLKLLVNNLTRINTTNREEIQQIFFLILKQNNYLPKEVFKGFYQVLVNKDFGPKAADLILQIGIKKVIDQLNCAVKKTVLKEAISTITTFKDLNNQQIFSIDKQMVNKYPSINIGIAIIKGITIQSKNNDLNNQIDKFIKSQFGLTTELLDQYPEIKSYRKVYREMGIDWHSRRPSPEALLRRIALNKGLYHINTCVDAYNLVVMKYRISAGAFDLDKIKLPTVLRFPKDGEEILLLGDHVPTKYKPTELAYFDQIGGYNIDFNYRDAKRTAITNDTKNILINIDGIYDITRKQVEKTLQETIDMIIKYCGGKLEIVGIVSAK